MKMVNSLLNTAQQLKGMIEHAKLQAEAAKDAAITQVKLQAEAEKKEVSAVWYFFKESIHITLHHPGIMGSYLNAVYIIIEVLFGHLKGSTRMHQNLILV